MRPGVPNPLAAVRLLRIVKQKQPHILQTWMYHADLLGLLIGKLGHVPSILWNIQCSDLPDDGWLSALVRQMLIPLSPLPGAVLVNSQSGLRFHKALGYRPRRWLYIPNSLDLSKFRPDAEARTWLRTELRLRPDAILIGLIARFHPVKDHCTFIEAARLLAANNTAISFVLVGLGVNGENRNLMRMISSTGVEDRFHLLSERVDVNRITSGLDVSCCSSYSEGSSNVIAEAMSCGVPCVATDVGDASFVLREIGEVVPPKDPAALARACTEVLGMSPERRVQRGLAARARVAKYFSLQTVIDSYQGLYEELALAPQEIGSDA
jgi:glycosyltransferase involved in cell wall biosynthesis